MLIDDIRNHLSVMNVGQRERQTAVLLREAAAEIERLRAKPCPYVTGTVTRHCTLTPLTLTDAEREAVETAANWLVQLAKDRGEIHSAGYLVDDAATLRGLLERTK